MDASPSSPRPPSVASDTSSARKKKSKKHGRHHHHSSHLSNESPIQLLLDRLNALECLNEFSERDKQKLGLHLYAISFGVRCAHWVKDIPMTPARLAALADLLKDFPTAKTNLAFLYEPISERVLALHRSHTLHRLRTTLDEGVDQSDERWFVKFDRQGNGSFVHPDHIPFFAKALKHLERRFEQLNEDEYVPVVTMEKNWISETEDEQQALLRMVTIQHFLLYYPAIYVIDEAASSVGEACNLLSNRTAWIGEVLLEGERQEDDHLLVRCTFPEGLFSYDEMDLSDKTALLSLREVGDRIQSCFLQRLDAADVRKVWRDVTVAMSGPFPHREAWSKCGLKKLSMIASKYQSLHSPDSLASASTASTDLSPLSEDK